jgi:hypothetical protein
VVRFFNDCEAPFVCRRTVTKEVIFLGTSGFSPAKGGIVNSVRIENYIKCLVPKSNVTAFTEFTALHLTRTLPKFHLRDCFQEDCSDAAPAESTELTMIGDVCISHVKDRATDRSLALSSAKRTCFMSGAILIQFCPKTFSILTPTCIFLSTVLPYRRQRWLQLVTAGVHELG